MNTKIFSISLILLFLSACNNNTKHAQEILNQAKNYYEIYEYASAKLMLDSLKKTYPQEAAIQKERLQLMRQVELKEQERNLDYCTGMLVVCEAKADSLKKNFLFEKDTIYDEIGKYFVKQQKIESNLQKSYIRCNINEQGEMFLESVYYGNKPINHTGIKVSTPTGEYTETQNIPRDGGLNYSFTDLGATTEIVTYKKDQAGGVVQFICDNHNEKLKVEYSGGKAYMIRIASADKNAVVETQELAVVLSDIDRLKKETQKAGERITYLKNKTNEDVQ